MKLDCYAVLGISPTAEDVVIRAAYLALMRNYHPDRNPSPEAAARVRAITEAYKTLGDPDRRAEYDARRRARQIDIVGDEDEVEPLPQLWRKAPIVPRSKAPVVGTIAASALAIVLAVTALPSMQRGPGSKTAEPAASRTPPADSAVAIDPAMEITAPELAAELPPPIPEAAVLQSPNEELEAIDLEPVPPVARKVAPESGATRWVTRTADARPRAPAKPAAEPKPTTAAEKARLAALESQATSFYNQSVAYADAPRRVQLQQARDLFVTSRDACRTDKCAGDAHANYIRDIAQIMQRKPTSP